MHILDLEHFKVSCGHVIFCSPFRVQKEHLIVYNFISDSSDGSDRSDSSDSSDSSESSDSSDRSEQEKISPKKLFCTKTKISHKKIT